MFSNIGCVVLLTWSLFHEAFFSLRLNLRAFGVNIYVSKMYILS